MKKLITLFILLNLSCRSQDLTILADLPGLLREVSGTEKVTGSELIWMINDAGNSPTLYGLDLKGKIKKSLKVNADNNDWEDLTTDDNGNLYIGDFGNNKNERTDLGILKIKRSDLDSTSKINVERISFSFPDQKKFPPKNKKKYFDCEAFFYFNNNLYLFTKSRVDDKHGRTTMYKIPAEPGCYEAKKITTYNNPCNKFSCWITSAAMSPDKSKIALLSPEMLLIFYDFEGDNFFEGKVAKYPFEFLTQKESVCFVDNNTVYITDEYSFGIGGNLYEFELY